MGDRSLEQRMGIEGVPARFRTQCSGQHGSYVFARGDPIERHNCLVQERRIGFTVRRNQWHQTPPRLSSEGSECDAERPKPGRELRALRFECA